MPADSMRSVVVTICRMQVLANHIGTNTARHHMLVYEAHALAITGRNHSTSWPISSMLQHFFGSYHICEEFCFF